MRGGQQDWGRYCSCCITGRVANAYDGHDECVRRALGSMAPPGSIPTLGRLPMPCSGRVVLGQRRRYMRVLGTYRMRLGQRIISCPSSPSKAHPLCLCHPWWHGRDTLAVGVIRWSARTVACVKFVRRLCLSIHPSASFRSGESRNGAQGDGIIKHIAVCRGDWAGKPEFGYWVQLV